MQDSPVCMHAAARVAFPVSSIPALGMQPFSTSLLRDQDAGTAPVSWRTARNPPPVQWFPWAVTLRTVGPILNPFPV